MSNNESIMNDAFHHGKPSESMYCLVTMEDIDDQNYGKYRDHLGTCRLLEKIFYDSQQILTVSNCF